MVVKEKTYFTGFFMKWKQSGKQYALSIGNQDVRTFTPIGEAQNAPLIPETGSWRSDAKNGVKLPMGTSIALVNLDTDTAHMSFFKYNTQTGRWESVKPNFVKETVNGQTKLLLSSHNIK